MWKIALMTMATSAAVMGLSRAEDGVLPEGAWCSHEDIGGGTVTDRCHFDTFVECRDANAGLGGVFCTQNPRYVAPRPVPEVAVPQSPVVNPQVRQPPPKRANSPSR